MAYEIKPLTEEEESFVGQKINEYADSMVPAEPRTGEEQLVRKIADEEGNVIGGCVGTYLMGEIEREAKDNGAYVVLSYCCDWASGFFFTNGYTARGELPDYPKGHTAYELEKRI